MTASASRDLILADIRRSLSRASPLFRSGPPRGPLTRHMAVTGADGGGPEALAARFAEKLTETSGTCEVVEERQEVPEHLARRFRAGGGGDTVLSWSPEALGFPDLESRLAPHGIRLMVPGDLRRASVRSDAAQPVLGLTGVEAAFASTGTILLTPGPGRSRVASLLPLVHVALVPMSKIVPTFEVWLRDRRGDATLAGLLRESGQLVFVTGPSKSADIEMNLTLGVHGPGLVHAVVFNDLGAR